MEDLTPLYNKEFYLAYLCGEDVVLPIPDGNAERYLAYLCGMDVTIPDVPDGRTETYLAYKCGEDVVLPDPMYRIEYYLAKWCGIDCEVPEPLYRIEYWLAQLANSGKLKTVTGNPISVSDALARPAESLTIEILPQQSGSGDPSPDNVRPISGHDSVKVTRTGKNLIPPLDAQNAVKYNGSGLSVSNVTDGIAVTGQDGGSSHAVGFIVLDANDFLGEQLTLSCDISADNSQPQIMLVTCDASYGSRSILAYMTTSGAITATIPQTAAGKKIGISLFSTTGADSSSAVSKYTNIQLELGSTATAYEPYNGTSVEVALGQTVYGGTLDVVSGVLTVDRAMVDMGSLTWAYNTTYAFFLSQSITTRRNGILNLWSDLFNTEAGSWSGTPVQNAIWGNASNKTFYVQTPPIDDVSDFMTLVNGHQLCYEIATPLVIQLTPTEIEMLLGENVIWNDVGDMVLEYLADGPADDIDALQILLNNRYVNNGEPDEATDREALDILLGGNTR